MVNGEALKFNLLGLYQGVFLMTDRNTGSVWAHLDGIASQGPLAGVRLKFLPLPVTTWAVWKSDHPNTTVLDNNTQYQQWYGTQYLESGNDQIAQYGDNRMPGNSLVVGVEANGAFTGFAVDTLIAEGGVVNAEVGGVPVVVVYDDATNTGIAYRRTVSGETLNFHAERNGGLLFLVDDQTSSRWTKLGAAISGAKDGQTLDFTTSFISKWYGWSAYHPGTGLYQ